MFCASISLKVDGMQSRRMSLKSPVCSSAYAGRAVLLKQLIIHNSEFDLSHLNNELKIIGKKPISNKVVDTLSLARDKFPGSSISLDALCKRFRIDNSKRTQHSALVDCDLLSKVYINLIDQKEPTLNFSSEVKNKLNFNLNNILYSKKIINLTKDEISTHKKYLNLSFKKNFF